MSSAVLDNQDGSFQNTTKRFPFRNSPYQWHRPEVS